MSATSDLILAARRHRSQVLLAQRDRGGVETLMFFPMPDDAHLRKLRDMLDADADYVRKMLLGEFPRLTAEQEHLVIEDERKARATMRRNRK
jgi:hypothetical protein